jgi:uncharacterized protein (DUF2236 family)
VAAPHACGEAKLALSGFMAPVLPGPEEYAGLVPSRSSPVWRYASDVRMFATAGYALLLQVAHPTVGAGVADHSNFREDPWGRFHRTLDYVHGTIYGGPQLAGEIGARVRDMHKHIKGVRADGQSYHALEPTAYAWVHATLASAIVHGHERFGTPLPPATAQHFWQDWLKLGRLIGVRERDLPSHWYEFGEYLDRMIETELEDNPTVHMVLATLAEPARPFEQLPQPLWRMLRILPAGVLGTTTVGMLPARARERLNLPWSASDARAFRRHALAMRAATPVIKGPLREFGPRYVKLRAKQLARGDVARGGPPSQRVAAPA